MPMWQNFAKSGHSFKANSLNKPSLIPNCHRLKNQQKWRKFDKSGNTDCEAICDLSNELFSQTELVFTQS